MCKLQRSLILKHFLHCQVVNIFPTTHPVVAVQWPASLLALLFFIFSFSLFCGAALEPFYHRL